MRSTIKAIVQEGYGSPDALKLRDIELPASADDGVLVEVHAASVNALRHLARGVPFFLPILDALSASKHRVRGVDLAGRVTAVGKNITRFKPGDEVLGDRQDAIAPAFCRKWSPCPWVAWRSPSHRLDEASLPWSYGRRQRISATSVFPGGFLSSRGNESRSLT